MFVAWIRNGLFEKVGEFPTRRKAWAALTGHMNIGPNRPPFRYLGVVVAKGDSPTIKENWVRWIEVRTGKRVKEKVT
jgi:hypothetical protein